jgi:hypothetical protein
MQLENQNPLVGEIVSLITRGIECWSKAGEIVVKLIDDHRMTIPEIAGNSEFLTEDIVARFEQLGRKQILPQLLVADYPAAKHVIKLPYSEQSRAVDEGIELLVMGDEGHSTLKVAISNLTPLQCKQVFAKDAIRSLPAQRAYIESQKTDNEIKGRVFNDEAIWKVSGRKVVFFKPCQMTARELAQIIAEIEK